MPRKRKTKPKKPPHKRVQKANYRAALKRKMRSDHAKFKRAFS